MKVAKVAKTATKMALSALPRRSNARKSVVSLEIKLHTIERSFRGARWSRARAVDARYSHGGTHEES